MRESISYDFGKAHRHGIFRDIPRRETYLARPGFDRLYRIDDVRVSADQATSAKTKKSTNGRYLHLRIGDPNKTVTGEHRYVISYIVRGAPGTFAGHDELFWDPIGNQWPVPINRATVVVNVPAGITKVGCTTGPPGSRLGCDRSSSDGRRADFAQANLAREAGVTDGRRHAEGHDPATARADPPQALDPGRRVRASRQHAHSGRADRARRVGSMLVLAWTGRDRRFKGSAVDAAMGNVTGDEGPHAVLRQARRNRSSSCRPPASVRARSVC